MIQRIVVRCGLLFLVALGGCFSPQFQDGKIACGPGSTCPSGLECFQGFCHAEDPGPIDAAIDSPPGMVRLTVARAGTGTGSVTSAMPGIDCGGTCTHLYAQGTAVTLTASPDAATTDFGMWSGGGCSGSTPTCTLTLTSDTTVTGTFALKKRTITVAPGGNGTGTVTSNVGGISCPGTCSAAIDHGTSVTLSAMATPPSSFLGWSGGSCTGMAPCTFAATSNVTINAPFAQGNTLVVTKTGNGIGRVTGSGIDCPGDCDETYAAGTTVTLTATADSQSDFAGWSGACSGMAACVVTINAATSVTAQFVLKKYALNVDFQGNGAGTVMANPPGVSCNADCGPTIDSGTVVVLSASAAFGSRFTGWSGEGCSGMGTCMVTMSQVRNVTATFTLERYNLTVSVTSAGGVLSGSVRSSPSGIDCGLTCVAQFDHGTMVSLTPTADPGAMFTGWSGACTGNGACVVTMTAAASVIATFATQQYTLSVERSGGGTGTVTFDPPNTSCAPPCSRVYSGTTTVTLTATPTAMPLSQQSLFTGWSGAGVSCVGTGPCTVTLSSDLTVRASFELKPNFVFVTTTNQSGNLGGLAGADAICQARATAGGIPGTFRAWLSSTTTSAASRLGMASGWVRKDNPADVWPPTRPWALTRNDLLAGRQLYTLMTEFGGYPGPTTVLTASTVNGMVNGGTCADWTVADNSIVGTGFTTGYADVWTQIGGTSCSNNMVHLTCLGIDRAADLPSPVTPTGTFRWAFATQGSFTPNPAGLASADQLCANEALGAGLPGTYRALLAMPGVSAASRFNAANGGPWVRVDNAQIAPDGQIFLNGQWDAAINVTPSKVYYGNTGVWTGASGPTAAGSAATTCDSWTGVNPAGTAISGRAGDVYVPAAFQSGAGPCTQGRRLYCLQQ